MCVWIDTVQKDARIASAAKIVPSSFLGVSSMTHNDEYRWNAKPKQDDDADETGKTLLQKLWSVLN